MKSILYLKDYNSYFNRLVKKEDNYEAYVDAVEDYYITPDINFNPNDGLSTQLTVNWELDWQPNYVVVLDEYNNIASRWFIMNWVRNRNGQYRTTVKRDIVVDSLDKIQEAPMFVQKGIITNPESPFLFNSEGGSYNQIKKQEILLKETDTPWLVGYLDREYAETETFSAVQNLTGATELASLPIKFNDTDDITAGAYFYSSTGDDFIGGNVEWGGALMPRRSAYVLYNENEDKLSYESADNTGGNIFGSSYKEAFGTKDFPFASDSENFNPGYNAFVQYVKGFEVATKLALSDLKIAKGKDSLTNVEIANLTEISNTALYSSATQKYYRMFITEGDVETAVFEVSRDDPSELSLWTILDGAATAFCNNSKWNKVANSKYYVKTPLKKYNIVFTEITEGQISASISASRNRPVDAPYDIFAMPFNQDTYNLANQMIQGLDTHLYDMQILPYCPARQLFIEGEIDYSLGVENIDYTNIANTNYKIVYPTICSGSIRIVNPIAVSNQPLARKIAHETSLYRLCSPNYNGIFEFSPYENFGVEYFNVDYTYKPYVPYIRVAPSFKGLYGQFNNDIRGLIFNGDFSVTMLSDAWKNYETQNKNFLNSFNRNIESMDKLRHYERIAEGFSIGAGTVSGAVSGVIGGAMAGGVPGAIVGGVVGGVTSLAGGIADGVLSQKSYQENKANQIAQFNYTLGNIKARPDTLTKVGAYNISNKYFPIIEIFEATQEEKNALRNKIKYDGMTVMAIGTMAEYSNRLISTEPAYFKAQLIRAEELGYDYNYFSNLCSELEKGVYL